MSQENVELVCRAFDALNRRDLDAHLALMDDDVEAISRLSALEGGFHGHDGIRRWWDTLFDIWPDFSVEIVDLRAVGELTLGTLQLRGQGAGSGLPWDWTVCTIARWRRGKCVWWGNFDTWTEANKAAGVSEHDAHADS